MAEETPARGLRFSSEINAGHLLQALTVAVVVGGGAITSYVSLRGDMQSVGERDAARTALLDARVLVIESRRQVDSDFQAETRTALTNVLQKLTKLEVDLARVSPMTGKTEPR